MKVLVVDDDVVSRMVLMDLIDRCGRFEILEAHDGEQAWRQLEQGLRPLICFCDLRMPRLSGLELLQRVMADPQLRAMPLVLGSAAADQATVRHAMACGAAGYMVKPFQAEQVRAHLAPLLVRAPHSAEAPLATLRRLDIDL
jgi:two-component system, chemotaxis family, chemotaxis protein CheY